MRTPVFMIYSCITRKLLAAILLLLLTAVPTFGQSKLVEQSTDLLCFAPSATGLVKAIVERDRKGLVQLGLGTVSGIAVNYGLNACIRKSRPTMPLDPDWGDRHAFPSTHTMAAFDGASFLMRRYGWRWGVPAYAVSAYVAWGRVYCDKHDWWDVLGGAAVGAGSAFLFTRPWVKNTDITLAPVAYGRSGAGIYLSVNF